MIDRTMSYICSVEELFCDPVNDQNSELCRCLPTNLIPNHVHTCAALCWLRCRRKTHTLETRLARRLLRCSRSFNSARTRYRLLRRRCQRPRTSFRPTSTRLPRRRGSAPTRRSPAFSSRPNVPASPTMQLQQRRPQVIPAARRVRPPFPVQEAGSIRSLYLLFYLLRRSCASMSYSARALQTPMETLKISSRALTLSRRM